MPKHEHDDALDDGACGASVEAIPRGLDFGTTHLLKANLIAQVLVNNDQVAIAGQGTPKESHDDKPWMNKNTV